MISRAEIAFADEQRRDENARRGNFRQNFFDLRFLFPERLADFGKNFPAAQFRRVLEDRRGGMFVQRRAVAEHHQRGIGKIFAFARGKVGADRAPTASRRPPDDFLLKPFAGFWRLKFKLSERNQAKLIRPLK